MVVKTYKEESLERIREARKQAWITLFPLIIIIPLVVLVVISILRENKESLEAFVGDPVGSSVKAVRENLSELEKRTRPLGE